MTQLKQNQQNPKHSSKVDLWCPSSWDVFDRRNKARICTHVIKLLSESFFVCGRIEQAIEEKRRRRSSSSKRQEEKRREKMGGQESKPAYSEAFFNVVAKELAEVVDEKGFVVFPSGLQDNALQEIAEAFMSSPKWVGRSPGNRWSVNSEANYNQNQSWQRLHQGLAGQVLTQLAQRSGHPLCIGVAGGDYALPCNAQSLHSDFLSYDICCMIYGYSLCVSVAVEDIKVEDGPIRIVPWSDRNGHAFPDMISEHPSMAVMVTMKKGDMLIRDVRCPHGGSAKFTEKGRLLPGLQVFSKAICKGNCHVHAAIW